MLVNSITEFMGNESKPINKIRLGGAHTIHESNGKICSDKFWYVPNYVYSIPFSPLEGSVFHKNSEWVFGLLKKFKPKYKKKIEDSMLRFVRALDERDQNFAIIRLWNALELLASLGEDNFNKISKRCSFLFSDSNFHEQVVEHLREYRNRNIHHGDESNYAKKICYQLQHYYINLILFHIRNVDVFESIEEANSYLDLPSDLESLCKRKEHIEKAIKFMNPEAN